MSSKRKVQFTEDEAFYEQRFVEALPKNPTQGVTYSFERIARGKVTAWSHGLHKYPAKFIPQIPQWALSHCDLKSGQTILDPFCGSGTTLVEAGVAGYNAIGTDISPLATLITQAKTTILTESPAQIAKLTKKLCLAADRARAEIETDFESSRGESCHGMHWTWANWFEARELGGLVALREAISEIAPDHLKPFLLACLSSITKACSRLDENQIKVRLDPEKSIAEPLVAFAGLVERAAMAQRALSAAFARHALTFDVRCRSAASTGVAGRSVDAIISSPPYLNAIDYTMNQKYNLFVTGVLDPDRFKEHCRDYIGVTERAVRVSDSATIPEIGIHSIDAAVKALQSRGTALASNRAFVVFQYFQGMRDAFSECRRVLKRGGKAIFVVGESNRICGDILPTAEWLGELANAEGLETSLTFAHALANRSSMRLNRSTTGGSISREVVYVFRKA